MEKRIRTFIEKSIQIHGDKYDYSKIKEVKSRKRIEILCKIHGSFLISPDNHIFQKSGCPKCARNKHKLIKISPERLEKIKRIQNNRYVYKDLSINDGFISIICPNHGEFSQRIYAHEKGHGCNKCYLESKNTKERIEKTRICKSCKEQLPSNEFNSKFKICKSCQENPIIPIQKVCICCKIEKNIEEFQPRSEQWDGYRNECIGCYISRRKKSTKIYRKKNKDILREKNKIYHNNRLKTDITYKVRHIAKNVIRKAISKGGYTKRSRTYEILGCSYEEFKIHIENLFQSGMNWDNRHLWDIDHIVPISLAESEEEMIILNYYSNLRPLWKNENEYKSDKVTDEVKSSPIYKELIRNRSLSFPSIYFGSFKVTIN